jgi:hypothetical protein
VVDVVELGQAGLDQDAADGKDRRDLVPVRNRAASKSWMARSQKRPPLVRRKSTGGMRSQVSARNISTSPICPSPIMRRARA